MKKLVTLLFVVIISSQFIFAQKTNWPMNGKIKVYFSYPVNTTVSSGTNAVRLDSCIADTLASYIGRAKKSLDFCVYNTSSSTALTKVINAVNSAYTRGVTVRWIKDSSQTNTALSSLNAGIHVIASPIANSTYGTSYIMHDKFMIIDGGPTTTNATDAIVWTGSADWSTSQFNQCYNNIVIIQDSALAHAYTKEFNQMWGSTTAIPNSTNSKFGVKKTASSTHSFTIGGSTVELYFSPMDATQTHIVSAINTANTDLYFGLYTFTTNNIATPIATKHTAGIYTAGIMDSYSVGCSACAAWTTLSASTALGTSLLKEYTGATSYYIYHNKFAIIDPSNPSSDPQVVTGSHNWSSGANSSNDENTLIIHNATVANMYYQSFYQDFTNLGGTLSTVTGENDITPADGDVYIYPNPVTEGSPVYLNINSNLNLNDAKLVIYDILGNKLKEISHLNSQQTAINCGLQSKGMYFYQLMNNNEPVKSGKFIVR